MTDESQAPGDGLVDRLKEWAKKRPRMGVPGGNRESPFRKFAELDAVRDLAKGLAARGIRRITDVRARPETSPATPPDILATNESGGLIGIEVTELVDEEVLRENLRRRREGDMDHGFAVRMWTEEEVIAEITCLLREKDAKPFAGDGYAERWLVVHHSEPYLSRAFVFDDPIGVSKQFDVAFLVGRFEPSLGVMPGYPVWQLNLGKAP